MSLSHYQSIRKQNLTFKIMLVGLGGVGKSSIMTRYIHNKFQTATQQTTGIDFVEKKIRYKDKNIRLELWDTTGQEVYRVACANRMKRANCVVFVYSLSIHRAASLDELIKFWIPTAKEICDNQTIFFCFGNKSDLVQTQKQKNKIVKQVELQMAQLGKTLQTPITCFQGNCKDNQNQSIQKMIQMIVKTLYQSSIIKEQNTILQYRKSIDRGQKPNPIQSSPIKLKSSIFIQQEKKKRKRFICF